ncbi:methyl-accepting chemotaxis protein [Cellulomonas aerilata]|uniref:Chemotaxis protein n=1 Tax=Cellulomonas aerilata TaxID=515326 RepID=A0A512D791_9CELL|nr:methyl-accepting chemotaxis protein [Cellulomonas aerilata]GEO32339.1 chemotaxis protein [Cellulomonas aerilata]
MTTTTPPRRSRLADLSVRTKIVAAVLVAAVVAATVGLVGLSSLSASNASTNLMYDDKVLGLEKAAGLRRDTLSLRLSAANQAISTQDAEMTKFETQIAELEESLPAAVDSYLPMLTGAEDRAALADFQRGLDAYLVVLHDELLPAGRANDIATWEAARDGAAADAITTMSDALTALVENEKETARELIEESEAQYAQSRTTSIVLLVVGLSVALAIGLVVARTIVRGLDRVRASVTALENGDLTVAAGLTSRDEVGTMGVALDNALSTLRSMVSTIDASSDSLAGAATELAATSVQIASGAEETAAQAGVVSAAAEQVSRNTQTVAAGTEEMGASIREIAHNASEASRIAAQAVSAAEETTTTVSRLGESSREIGTVVKAITSIAEQTNLLALNATIEAARAGEAGKGFAVVAGEVKELAQETARATEDIARRVQAIQADTTGAVEAIGNISSIVASINDFQATIAAAVEEQTATTNEMTRNVSEAASGSGEIAVNISGVADAAALTTQGAGESQRAVDELARMSSDLKVLVGSFRY